MAQLQFHFFNVCHPIMFDIITGEMKLISTQQVSVLLLIWLH